MENMTFSLISKIVLSQKVFQMWRFPAVIRKSAWVKTPTVAGIRKMDGFLPPQRSYKISEGTRWNGYGIAECNGVIARGVASWVNSRNCSRTIAKNIVTKVLWWNGSNQVWRITPIKVYGDAWLNAGIGVWISTKAAGAKIMNIQGCRCRPGWYQGINRGCVRCGSGVIFISCVSVIAQKIIDIWRTIFLQNDPIRGIVFEALQVATGDTKYQCIFSAGVIAWKNSF